jgi:hypothetical protein
MLIFLENDAAKNKSYAVENKNERHRFQNLKFAGNKVPVCVIQFGCRDFQSRFVCFGD